MFDPEIVAKQLADYDTEIIRFPESHGRDDNLLVVR